MKTIKRLLNEYKTNRDILKINELKKVADYYCSIYVRLRDNNTCFTCGSKHKPQNGHFVPRTWSLLRYDLRNNNCQCYSCNVCRKGNLDEYAFRLQEKYGKNIVEVLHNLKIIHQFKYEEIYNIIDNFIDLIKKFKQEVK